MPDILGFDDRRADNPDYVRTRSDGEPIFYRGKNEIIGWANLARSKKVEKYRKREKQKEKAKSNLEKLLEEAQKKLNQGKWKGNFILIERIKGQEKSSIVYTADSKYFHSRPTRDIAYTIISKISNHYLIEYHLPHCSRSRLIMHDLDRAEKRAYNLLFPHIIEAQQEYWDWYNIYKSQLERTKEHGMGKGLLPIKDKTRYKLRGKI